MQIAAYKDFKEKAKLTLRSTPRYFAVVTLIEANPGLPQARLADEIHLGRSSLVSILGKLEAEGLEQRCSPCGPPFKRPLAHHQRQTVPASQQPVVTEHERRLTEGLNNVQKAELLKLLDNGLRLVETRGGCLTRRLAQRKLEREFP